MHWRVLVLTLTCIIFCAGVALISVALATKSWAYATPILRPRNASIDPLKSVDFSFAPKAALHSEQRQLSQNLVSFGLFDGLRTLDYGSGSREVAFNVRSEIKQGIGFFDLAAWIAIILFAVLALFWAIIGALFSLINILFQPFEILTGPMGLYLWSTLAMLCSFVSVVVFIAQYFINIAHNVMLVDQLNLGWTSDELAWFGYSFWLMVASVGLFSLNALILLAAGVEVKSVNFDREKRINIDSGAFIY